MTNDKNHIYTTNVKYYILYMTEVKIMENLQKSMNSFFAKAPLPVSIAIISTFAIILAILIYIIIRSIRRCIPEKRNKALDGLIFAQTRLPKRKENFQEIKIRGVKFTTTEKIILMLQNNHINIE